MAQRDDGIEVRTLRDDEWPRWHRTVANGFGHAGAPPQDVCDAQRALLDAARATVAVDGDEVVGTCGSYAFGLVVPGGAEIPAAGITDVVVRPTHRRRGLLTAMLGDHLDAARRRGEAVAILNASEAAIYGRFGFGEASRYAVRSLPPHPTWSHPPAPHRLRWVRQEEAGPVLAERYAAARHRRPGAVSRPDRWWDLLLGTTELWKGGGRLQVVVADPVDERGGGYAVYHMRPRPSGWFAIEVRELVADTPEVEAALWHHLCEVDLAEEVVAEVPVDDPLPLRLADPRSARTRELRDYLWVRLLDVPAALSARGWSGPCDLVLELTGGRGPDVAGRYRLVVAPDGRSACEPVEDPPDLVLGVAELGAAYLGGTSLVALGAAGRAEERTPGSLAAAELAFSTPVAPFCATRF